jgi:two-component system, cell cycle sensor histidine kinase and response regulator CckA
LMGMGILKEQYPEEDKLINMIHNSATRGADMVRQLLTFAKGADGQRLVLQPAHLMHELESLMTGSFPKNIDIQVNIEAGLPSVVGDATQLHQILLNLSVNARDAMPNGGVLTMEAKSVEIDEIYARSAIDAKPGMYVCLRVSDNGEGIPAHILDRIFDPFFTTKAQDKGTGLGLSTVLGIVKGHGGFLQVHSTPGKGTTFTVYLPVSPSHSVVEEIPHSAQMFKGQGESILFVDDEQALREVGQTVLERLNFRPIMAKDGEDGLAKATENRTVLKAIITDIHMPNMDGLAFVQAVRRTLPDIPIILASGRVDDSVAKEFRALGVTMRLDKPFTELQLADKLGSLLQQPVT